MSRAFGIPDFTMGSIIVAYMIPYGVAALLYGPLSRVVNTKKVALYCLFVFSISSFVSGIVDSIASPRSIDGIPGPLAASMTESRAQNRSE